MPRTRSATAKAAAVAAAAAAATETTAASASALRVPDALVPPTPVPAPAPSPAAAPKPTSARHTIDDLPADVLALILDQMVATDSLSALLRARCINKHWKSIVEGAQFNALYKRTLERWGVKTEIKPRARKFKTLFAVLIRELQNGRCSACARGKLDPTTDAFGGRCRECRLANFLDARDSDEAAFKALPPRKIIGLPGTEEYRSKKSPKLYKGDLSARLHLPKWVADRLPYRTRRHPFFGNGSAPMRLYDVPTVEIVMAAWTERTEPPIDIGPYAPDWRERDRQLLQGGEGQDVGKEAGGQGASGADQVEE
ncbi:hypothetical protein AMAG_04834 [Allomyces macrogynus ATCC 38327]|uniref:F-box domain-containing protein n=1 Tax=Allomyces macrogynus (strain ATCC 38327) TaxID=578462 RepID=A0A0L0S6F5_ALLM3|nr:hypothetical protein AMAG_04834 [Allomyces macrogynus ATCC 38327]|eukprot:KNE58005.1 hypothetical protein AMAG_04834 [Allomyces macrogynus ATCC 38327]